MKKKGFARIIWISCIFLELIIILIMVMDYKINYQYLKQNKLYFYDCDGILCVTEVEDNKHLLYSTYNCEQEECPTYKMELTDTYALLSTTNHNILYNYRNAKIISQKYDNYQFLNNKYIIITQKGKQGIINLQDKVIIEPIYDQLGYIQNNYLTGYNLNNILAKQNDQYGIVSFKTGEIIEPIQKSESEVEKLLEILKKDS